MVSDSSSPTFLDMRTVLLTTDTPHHLYFASQVATRVPWHTIVLESGGAPAAFETRHPFEAVRDHWERETLLASGPASFQDVSRVIRSASVNDQAVNDALAVDRPDVMVVFGTGKIRPALIASAGIACLNLHGGNPEAYRGLDSHMWAIYHNDFANLVTTLHHVEPELDTGAIVRRQPVALRRGMELHELRGANTKVCVDITLEAMAEAAAKGSVGGTALSGRGRYYSFMPAVLKTDCLRKFQRHASKL